MGILLFQGIAQAGAWSCFDELNRIQLQVLSVIAQQVQNIHAAIISKTERFIFEGIEITINPSCAIFITLNPGYVLCIKEKIFAKMYQPLTVKCRRPKIEKTSFLVNNKFMQMW